MMYEMTEYAVCADCYAASEYGFEVTGDGDYDIEGTVCEIEPLRLIPAELKDHLAPTGAEHGFTWRPCEGCGTDGGDRFEIVAMA